MTITTEAAVAAFQKGAAAATEMLKTGNIFEGAFQIADKLFARTTPEWDFAVKGAYIEIEHFPGGIVTDREGRLV